MGAISKAALKAFFETGDKPTQAQFADFIDSYNNTVDNGAAVTKNFAEQVNQATVGVGIETLSSIFVIPANTLNTNFQSIRISAWGIMQSSATQKLIGILWNGLGYTVAVSASVLNLTRWKMVVNLMRINANLQTVVVQADFTLPTLSMGSPRPAVATAAPIADLTANQNIEIIGQSGTAGHIVLDSWLLEILR